MKNRKLFAILTLVAFMMTLLPMAAFAAGPNSDERLTSSVAYSATTVEADGQSRVKLTINLKNGSYDPVAGSVYLATNRGASVDWVYSADDETSKMTSMGAGATNVFEIPVDADGETNVWVQSKVSGPAKFAVGNVAYVSSATSVFDYLIGVSGTTEYSVGLIPNSLQTITFAATDVDAVTPGVATNNDPAKIANGTHYYEITFTAKTKGGTPVANETMTFSLDKTGASLNKTEATTDASGQAKVKVYATKSGTYTVEAKVGSKKGTATAKFYAGEPTAIELVKGGNDELTSKDANYTFTVKILDAAGNKFAVTGTGHNQTTMKNTYKVDFEVMTKPTDSSISKSSFTGEGDDDSYLKVTIPASNIKKEGKYVVRAYLDNGKYVDVAFESKKQGDIVGIELKYDVTSLALGGKSDAPEVKRVDANGVKATVLNSSSDLIWSVNDLRKVSTVAAEEINAVDGIVYATTDKDYAGDLVVTVVDKAEDKTASFTIKVGVQPIAIEVASADAVVGESTAMDLVVKDANGNQVAFGEGYTFATTYNVLSKPDGALVTLEDGSKFAANLRETGKASVKVTSNKTGDVKVNVVVVASKSGQVDKYFSTQFTAKIAAPAGPKVTYGAANVTMFIGSVGYVADGAAKTADQAPFIQEGRTYVPVRMVGEALGAEVEFDAATQVITLTRADMTITMTVGSNVLTKSDGSTVVADVAPFIVAETGRTVIPFRAIAEAFGATVEAVFAADGTVNAVTFQQ
ncbi:MAG: stalk domain-containing protein [Bacillota bacterium]